MESLTTASSSPWIGPTSRVDAVLQDDDSVVMIVEPAQDGDDYEGDSFLLASSSGGVNHANATTTDNLPAYVVSTNHNPMNNENRTIHGTTAAMNTTSTPNNPYNTDADASLVTTASTEIREFVHEMWRQNDRVVALQLELQQARQENARLAASVAQQAAETHSTRPSAWKPSISPIRPTARISRPWCCIPVSCTTAWRSIASAWMRRSNNVTVHS